MLNDKIREIIEVLTKNVDEIYKKINNSGYKKIEKDEWLIEGINGYDFTITRPCPGLICANHPHLQAYCEEKKEIKLDTANKILERINQILAS